MKSKTGTEFTSADTNHFNNPNGESIPVLMSPQGKKMASYSAPSSAFKVRTSSTPAVKGGE